MPALTRPRRGNGTYRRHRSNQDLVDSRERRLHSFKSKDNWRLGDGAGNVDRIAKILRVEGCRRLSERSHVPILVDPRNWESHVFTQQRTLAVGVDLPQLGISPNYTLVPLSRKSLIVAAERYFRDLRIEEPWWIVDIYVSEPSHDIALQSDAFRTIKEDYTNEKRPSDGQIYRSLRLYQGVPTGVRNKAAENYWWGVLEAEPGSRKSCYLRALRPVLRDAFDALLPITGIWEGMSIGVLHKINAMKCDEPICCYLEHIRQTFMYIVGDDRLLSRVDAATVKIICSRAPAVSLQDLCILQAAWEEDKLFQFMEPQVQLRAWANLQTIDFIIPTLTTFFQDILYLEVAQTPMRKLCLIPPKGDETIDTVLGRQKSGGLAVSDTVLLTDEAIHQEQLWNLWRFSCQYAYELTHKKDHHRRVPRKREDVDRAFRLNLDRDPGLIQTLLLDQFFYLAYGFGFETPFPIQSHEPLILQLVPSDFPPDSDDDVDIERRCGKPFTDCVDTDRFALSEESLGRSWESQRVSAGFVRRCVFQAFFAYLHRGSDSGHSYQRSTGLIQTNRSSETSYLPTEDRAPLVHAADSISTPVISDREAEFLETFGDMPWEI